MSDGRLIVFEGPHASGKTTQAKMLSKCLRNNGIESRYTKEPYHHDFKPLIEKYSKCKMVRSPVLLYLLAADRYIHVNHIISWMKKGWFVVSDRYVFSGWVYQRMQGIPPDKIRRVNDFAIKPHLTFYMDVPLKERLIRLHRTHTHGKTYFLRSGKIAEEQELYEQMIRDWDEARYGRVMVLDGEQSIQKINNIVVDMVLKELR